MSISAKEDDRTAPVTGPSQAAALLERAGAARGEGAATAFYALASMLRERGHSGLAARYVAAGALIDAATARDSTGWVDHRHEAVKRALTHLDEDERALQSFVEGLRLLTAEVGERRGAPIAMMDVLPRVSQDAWIAEIASALRK